MPAEDIGIAYIVADRWPRVGGLSEAGIAVNGPDGDGDLVLYAPTKCILPSEVAIRLALALLRRLGYTQVRATRPDGADVAVEP